MNPFQLEQEIEKVSLAILTRNRLVIQDIINHLSTQRTPEEVAGILLIALERLIGFEPDLVRWSIENVIPFPIRLAIKNIITVTTYKQLIGKGLEPGKDFSIDANGKVLQKPCRSAYRL